MKTWTYKEWKNFTERWGDIEVRISPYEIPPGANALTRFNPRKEKFEIILPEENPSLLQHELLHIWRGDLIRMTKENLNPLVWNIATDVNINEMTRDPYLLEYGLSEMKLRKEFPDAPSWKLGAKAIYDYLIKKIPPPPGGDGPVGPGGLPPIPPRRGRPIGPGKIVPIDQIEPVKPEDLEKARKIWEKIIRKNIEEFSDKPEKYPEHIRDLFRKSIETVPPPPKEPKPITTAGLEDVPFQEVKVPPKPNPIIKKIRPILESEEAEGIITWRRTFRRTGRVPELPREIPYPGISVLLVVDISGSMSYAYKMVLSFVSYLMVEWNIKPEIIYFSGSAKKVTGKLMWAGGGTNYSAVLDLLKKQGKNYDIIIVISDYEFFGDDLKRIPEIKKYGRYVFFFDEELNPRKF
jgi:hypothetical protein